MALGISHRGTDRNWHTLHGIQRPLQQKILPAKLGTIKCSNLCTEIVEYTSPEEVAVCNLASIALPKYVNKETLEFDYEILHKITKRITRNLNKVIDENYYN